MAESFNEKHLNRHLCNLLISLFFAFLLYLVCYFTVSFISGYVYVHGNYPSLQRYFLCILYSFLALGGIYYILNLIKSSPAKQFALALFLFVFFLVKLYYMDFQTADYQWFLNPWVTFYRNNGGFSIFYEPVGNYNVAYLYFLALLSYLPFLELYLIKFLSILFDVLLIGVLIKLVQYYQKPVAYSYAVLVLGAFFPSFLVNSAWWAQCDTIYTFFALQSFYCALKGNSKGCFMHAALSFAVKLQSVFYFPLILVFLFTRKIHWKDIWVFPFSYFVSILPALLLGKPLMDILNVYLNQTAQYTYSLTLNAPSIYQFVQGDAPTDIVLKWGVAITALLTLLLLYQAYRHKDHFRSETYAILLLLFTAGIPMLLPCMHERYWTIAEAACILLVVLIPRIWYILPLQTIVTLCGYLAYLKGKYIISMRFGAVCLIAEVLIVYVFFLRDIFRDANKKSALEKSKAEDGSL